MNELELENHIEKCRICLWQFELEDVQIKITPVVEERFLIFTQIELDRPADKHLFSSTICESCSNKLRSFFYFREEAIKNQLRLINYVEETISYKKEPQEDEINYITTEILLSDSLEQTPEYTAEYLEEGIEEEIAIECVQVEQKIKKQPKKFYKRAVCRICGGTYYKDQLKRHIDKVHHKIKRYFCDLCSHGTFLKCNLASHMAKHVAKEFREQINCLYCPSTFTRSESLKNHMKIEHYLPVRMLKCFCGKEFNLKHKLTTHIKRTHDNTRNHACTHCDKRFFTPKELKVHILKKHSPGYIETLAYFCEICGKQYSSNKSLKTHMKYHQEPEFRCSYESCRKGFITKLLLMNHEKTHLNQRDQMCHLCDKSFFSANHLRRHISVTHDKVRINCFIDGCRFAVGRKDYLRNHILTHRELPDDVKNEYLIKIRDMKM